MFVFVFLALFTPQTFCLAMLKSFVFSSNPKKLVHFYETKHGLLFHEFWTKDGNIYIGKNSAVSILKAQDQFPCIGGLIHCSKTSDLMTSCEIEYTTHGSFCYIHMELPEKSHDEIFSNTNNSWIPIIRSCTIHETKNFYENKLADWQKEKHGSGPEHYALIDHGQVFEIYPCRTKNPQECIEFMIQHPEDSTVMYDCEGRRIQFIPSKD